jgi:hypothetical protein
MNKRILNVFAVCAVACGLTVAAQAQVGSGWTSTSVNYKTQISSGCTISGSSYTVPSGSTGRAERRYDTLTSGSRQFQGTLVVNSLGGDRISCWQTFSETNGPFQMGAVQKSGSLYEVSGGATLASYSVGSSVRVNTTATSSGSVQVYINGSQKESKTGGDQPYNKVGAYITGSGTGPCKTTWTSISFWKK